MHKGAELLRFGLSGQDGDASAIAHAKRGSDLGVVDKLDALGLEESH